MSFLNEITWGFTDLWFLFVLSNHVLTEDIIFREVTPSNCLISRRLLTKTSRSPRWMERYLPKHMSSSAYIIEDSIVDPQKQTMTTLTWNITHARLMVHSCLHPSILGLSWSQKWAHVLFLSFFCMLFQSVEERCHYQINPENGSWTEIKREAWISSGVYGLSRAIQVSKEKTHRKHHSVGALHILPTYLGLGSYFRCEYAPVRQGSKQGNIQGQSFLLQMPHRPAEGKQWCFFYLVLFLQSNILKTLISSFLYAQSKVLYSCVEYVISLNTDF